MKSFCFTVDDNIRFLKEITEKNYKSIFDHPYTAMFRHLHEEFDLKIQLNLFYRTENFTLSQMRSKYYNEWKENADWLKLSFHSDFENVRPYKSSGYDEVYSDCKRVNDEIIRFASPDTLSETTTVHYCLATKDGLKALKDNKIIGLLGLFGNKENPQTSYGIKENKAEKIRNGEIVKCDKISFGSIDVVLNCFSKSEILAKLKELSTRNTIKVMIHEQYFYTDYVNYQPDFEEKLKETFSFLNNQGYKSRFFEEMI